MENQDAKNLLNDTADLIEKMTDDIKKCEQENLKKIFWRFLIKKAILGDIKDVYRKDFPGRKNYWQYYYKYPVLLGVKAKPDYFLMSRELFIITDDEGKLDVDLRIDYNAELCIENEL